MSDLQSTEPHPIKVMDSISDSDRANVKALENAKTGKVTTVVAVMHLYGNVKGGSIMLMPKLVLKRPICWKKRYQLSSKSS